jgi:hypothetical protein
LGRILPDDWLHETLFAQIEAQRPEVVYFQDLNLLHPSFARRVRPLTKLIVGQIACPLPSVEYVRGFDLILTSFPHYVNRLLEIGVRSEYFRIGFEDSLLSRLHRFSAGYPLVFVGGISDVHSQATSVLERVASEFTLDFWGYGTENLRTASPLLGKYHGEAWGLDMYGIFYNSRIVLNRHSAASENYANNMRLYEATGAGAFLLTDRRDNLRELFEVGREIEDYGSEEELVDKIRYYLEHEHERASIARAGQQRTLREHTYQQRMLELEDILGRHL